MSTVPTSPTGPTTAGGRTTSSRSTGATRPRGGAFDTRAWWRPETDDLIDGGAALVLAAIVGFGFTTVYDGTAALVVCIAAALVGVVAGWLIGALRVSALVGLGIALLAFVIGGGLAVPDSAIAGFLPGPRTPGDLASALVHSWRDLLTTAAPAGIDGGLGAIPYVAGYVAGLGGMVLARRTTVALAPAAPVLASLVLAILFGAKDPASIVIQGAGFTVVALAWSAHRANRARRGTDGIYWPRVGGAVAMLVVLVPVGLFVGPALPFVEAHPRKVLREEVIPPFDAASYASPLAGLRAYRKAKDDRDRTFLEVKGLPKGALIRVATMDTYNGVVWTVSGDDSASGMFERVGAKILPVPPWEAATIEVTIPEDGYTGVWLPSVGATKSVRFSGPDADALAQSLRYNATTGTAAVPYELAAGNRYTLDVRIPPKYDAKDLEGDQPGGSAPQMDTVVAAALSKLGAQASTSAGSASNAYRRVEAIEKELKTWYFSDDADEDRGAEPVPAGHSAARLTQLLADQVGNAEQYASAMALMVRQLGMPARVVFGFQPEGSGDVAVKGTDATAWVEVNFAEHGWVPFFPTPDEDQKPEDKPPPKDPGKREQQAIPPPTYVEPPATIPPQASRNNQKPEDAKPEASDAAGLPRGLVLAATYVGLPLLLIGGLLGLIVGLKAWRGRRRRTRGTPVERLNGAWLEVLDRLRDIGHNPTRFATRHEVALAAAGESGWDGGVTFASHVDAHMFGPDEPDDQSAAATWLSLDEQVKALHAPLTRRGRIRAAVSLRSLRPGRASRPGRGPDPERQ